MLDKTVEITNFKYRTYFIVVEPIINTAKYSHLQIVDTTHLITSFVPTISLSNFTVVAWRAIPGNVRCPQKC